MSEVNGIKIIGAEKEAISELHKLIMDILGANVENETKRTALEIVGKLARVENTLIQDCTINLSPSEDNH